MPNVAPPGRLGARSFSTSSYFTTPDSRRSRVLRYFDDEEDDVDDVDDVEDVDDDEDVDDVDDDVDGDGADGWS